MVFESIVADLLNRFLGDFVDNLDSSQLNIGIWGGDVKLENLEVKETALDDLDLPVKLKFGYLSSLVLKIPWKNLYNEPVIATVDGLHLIVVPNKGVVYNEEKAKKNIADIKQKTLARLEEARKNRRKPPDPAQDSFAEKMVTQIIKNLQVSVSNIHIRFEDKYTNRHRPFVAGISLQKLDFQTTDDDWMPTIHREAVKIIHKLVTLDNLAVYWNSDAKLYSDLTDKAEIKKKMHDTITTGKHRPIGFKYILEPIKMEAKLSLNQKPETDGSNWTIPKIDLSVDMHTLALMIAKYQYQDILLFLEAQERFQLAGQYLKYRPNIVEYKGNYKQWWNFAYKSILEEKVRRRRNNWSWERIKKHRQLVRDYKEAWVKHQTESSPGTAITDLVKKAEEKLNVFNVNVARQQAEMEIDRRGLMRLEDQPKGWVGWAKSWWGGSGQPANGNGGGEKKQGKDIVSQFEEAMTPEEKAKLFEAIDYQENIPPTNYPKEFVENKIDFKLGSVAIVVDGAVSMQLLQLKANIEQRPSAGAINVKSGIRELRMDGCGAEMLRVRDPSQPWLQLEFDTNPLHAKWDQFVKLNIAPVTLKYHAPAVNNAADVFKPPESVKLNQLTALAMSRYEEVKTRSVTGLAHAVENKTKTILDIQISPATLMISEGGIYAPEKPTLLADLGLLSITTVDAKTEEQMSGMDKMARLREQAYDRFRVKLSNVVIALAENLDKAKGAIALKESPLHILKPTGLDIQLHKSGIDDLSLPKMRILGDLPDIIVAISDQRLLMMLKLLASIPKPEPDVEPVIIEDLPPVKSEVKAKDRAKMRTIMEAEEVETEQPEGEEKKEEKKPSEQQVQIELDLKLNTIGVIIFRGDDVLTDIRMQRFMCQLQMRTFDMVVKAELGSISFAMPMFKALDVQNDHLFLINNNSEEGALMKLKFVQANPESPFFATEYHKTEQAVDFKFSKLNVALHQQGLMELKKFGEDLQAKMAEIQQEQPDTAPKSTSEEPGLGRKLSRKLSESMESLAQMRKDSQTESALEKKRKQKTKKEEEPDPTVIKMRIDASIGQLAVLIGTEKQLETVMAIENVHSEVRMTLKTMDVQATLQAITMQDMTKGALYKDLMAVHGNDTMLKFEMTQFNRNEQEKKAMLTSDVDMKMKVRLAQMRFVFLNLWVQRLMAWLAPFQAEAAKAAAHAQAVAAEKSHEALEAAKQMLEQSPPRIEMDIELLAPLILVPRLSSSVDVLVIDLGNLTVRNKITGDKLHPKAVVDRMDVKLTEVNFGIGRMDDAVKRVASKCEILKPITFSISLHRNLTFGIVKDIPEIAVNAHIPSIECAMAQEDYTTLMQTLSGNLAEGQDLATPPVASPSVQSVTDTSKKEDRMAAAGDDKAQQRTISTSAASPSEEGVKSKPRIVFQFALDHIGVILYTGASASGRRDEANAFALMKLEVLKLSGSIKEDNAMKVALSLNTFIMNDERRDKTKISRLMDKKDGHEEMRFLDLAFMQNAKQDKNVKLKMSAFFLCLCPEFLGCLSSFFAVPKSQEEIDREAKPTSVKAPAHVQQAIQDKGAETETEAAPVSAMTMDCDMQGVEVILVENSMDPDNTQALILSFNVKLVAEPRAHEQVMHGGIEKLRVFSSFYAQQKRRDVTYEVLKAVDIGVALRIQNETKATDVILKMTPMELKMAPSVIRLLSAVNTEFAKSSQVENLNSSSVPRRRFYTDYWKKKTIEENRFWFFKVPVAEEATEEDEDDDEDEEKEKRVIKAPVENCTVEIPRLSFTLEAGNEAVPLPLIFLDMRMNADAHNWSSALKANTDMSLQMSYYNEGCSVWEPVIEPNEVTEGQWERWNLKMTVEGRNKLDKEDTRPNMDIKIEADKILNVTVTKSFLGLLTKLSEVFEAAAKQTSPPMGRHLPGLSPFIILNDTGMTVKVSNTDTLKVSDDNSSIDATHGAFVDLMAVSEQGDDRERRERVEDILSLAQEETRADLRLELLDTVREIVVGRADKKVISLPKKSDGGKQWKVVCDVSIENSRRLITLRSHVQVDNHLDVDMEIYSKRDTTLDLAGVVPAGGTINLPVPLLYTPTGELLFKPVNDKCDVSFESVSWHEFAHQKRATVRCNLIEDESKGTYFDTVVTEEKVAEGIDSLSSTYTLHLWPPFVFQNTLPFPVKVELPTALELAPGEESVLNVVAGHRLKLETEYMGEKYVLDMKLEENPDNLQVVALNTETGSSELLLGMHWSREHGGLKGTLYAPFWLVNNTSLTLRHMNKMTNGLEASEEVGYLNEYALRHLADVNPVILPFPSTDVGQKKKSRVQVEGDSGWSDEFPLDTVGNAGRVTCKGPARDYEMTVSIQLCQSGLTKIVTFTPFYLVSNCGKFDVQVREDGQKDWTTIPAETCIGVWPNQRSKRKLMCAKYDGAEEESLLFPFTENIETLAQINDDSAGFDVASTVGESSATVHITPFTPGSAPLHIINHLKIPIRYGQKGQPQQTLEPKEHVFFTWADITGARVFEYAVGDSHDESKLDQNKFGELQPDKGQRRFIYYANFLNGRQRTLLFEEDLTIAKNAFGSWELDVLDMQCELKLQGIGLSMVDNQKGMEVLFIGISSSDILWEEEVKKGRFKPLAVKHMEGLEEKFQECATNKTDEWQTIDKFEVNMKNMMLRKKNGKELKLRRIFEKGIWAHYGKSPQRTRLHFKLNHLQIDNQLDACVFPCVLSVVPPPKSVIEDNAPKPFVELSFLQRNSEYSTIPEIEYCRVLVQEFAVRVDQGLINAMISMTTNQASQKAYDKEMFEGDLKLTTVKLSDMADSWKSQKPKSFYDDLHISPLMIHLSFSQGGTSGEDGATMPIQSEFINVLLKSVGVSLTELQDVVFKLAYFERKCVFYNQDQLNGEIISHYTKQAIKQLYVLVLGLDIIGNPFGLVRDLSAGVEDLFYQPFQGAIQGPEEFAAGVALGVQSMFGHAVGGAAGAVGRITGTVGKGVAALTFDQDYQRKRQEDLNRRPQTFAEGMARGFKGLGMGVVDGVTGVVTKPIEGARQEGFGGFFKGAGKGLVGVVTRPISGVVDFASSSLDAVKTVAGTHKDTGPIRPPRLIKPDHIVRPYSAPQALGNKIFKDTDRGALTETDHFICYAPISEKVVLLVTNRQLIISKRTDVMGTWTADWQTEYTKIHEPQFVKEGVKIRLLEKKKGFLGLGGTEGKIITFQNAQAIQQKIFSAFKAAV